jgi:predicted permease
MEAEGAPLVATGTVRRAVIALVKLLDVMAAGLPNVRAVVVVIFAVMTVAANVSMMTVASRWLRCRTSFCH